MRKCLRHPGRSSGVRACFPARLRSRPRRASPDYAVVRYGVHSFSLCGGGGQPADHTALDPTAKIPELKVCAVRLEQA